VTDITTRLQELQETIRRAQAEIDDLRKTPMQKAVDAFESGVPVVHDLSENSIEAGLRAAWPHLKAAMDDDWIPWSGGECPVDPDTKVRARLRSGSEYAYGERAGSYAWYHDGPHHRGGYCDIVAYKVCNQ
jgi:hypothetical protein